MRNVILSVIGWVIVASTVADVFRTVLWSSQGAGPITGTITAACRRILPPGARRNRTVLSALGPIALATTMLTWAMALLVGFTLTLQMDPDGLRAAATGEPADWYERAYVVGYSVFTLGNGDFSPSTDLMRTLVVLINAAGMLLITVSVTYLVPVISASVKSRSFADSVLSLGDSAEDIVTAAWDGRRVNLDHQIRSFSSELTALAQQHLAYPVLHLFHSREPDASAPLAVARLDDLLTLLDAVDQGAVPPAPGRRQLRSSIQRYLSTYGKPVTAAQPAPATPDLDRLRAAGVPLRVDDVGFEHLLHELEDHRSRVQTLAVGSGIDGR